MQFSWHLTVVNTHTLARTLAHSLVKYYLQLPSSALLRLLTLSSSAGNCLLSHALQSKCQRQQQQQCYSIYVRVHARVCVRVCVCLTQST